MNLTGSDNLKLTKIALIGSMFLNSMGFVMLFDPFSMIMIVMTILWYMPAFLTLRMGQAMNADVVGIPAPLVQRIVLARYIGMLLSLTRIVFVLLSLKYWWYYLPHLLGSVTFAATGYFMLDFQPPRKSWSRRAIDWIKSRDWSLSGGHLPAPSPT
jgi:hypothetical protein